MPPKKTEKKTLPPKRKINPRSDAYTKIYRKTKKKVLNSAAFLDISEKGNKIRRDLRKWKTNDRMKRFLKISRETKKNMKILNDLETTFSKLKNSNDKHVSMIGNFFKSCCENVLQCMEESNFVLSLCKKTHENFIEQYNSIKNLGSRNQEMWKIVFSELNNKLKEMNTVVPVGENSSEDIKNAYKRLGKPILLREGTKYNKNNFSALYISCKEEE